jgi:hypothetical protein
MILDYAGWQAAIIQIIEATFLGIGVLFVVGWLVNIMLYSGRR